MNKQLVAFLSMLSLVLVLSVYYVMLPFGKTTVNDNSLLVSNVVTTTDDAYFASLIAEQDNNYELLCDQNYEILAESTYSQEDKVKALETLSKLETKRNKENIIKELILGKGHPSCFIEIKDDTVYVYIKSKPTDNKSIVEIMELVDSILPNFKIYIKFI